MTNKTKIDYVKNQLSKKGFITRNHALMKFISRLSGIIKVLRNRGAKIHGGDLHYEAGVDYVYFTEKHKNKKTIINAIKKGILKPRY